LKPSFLLSLDISIDPDYGFVKAIRVINSCRPKRMVSDTVSMFIHADFEASPEDVLKCVEDIDGVASIDVKLCLRMSADARRVQRSLREMGFTLVPAPLAQRIIAYKRIDDSCIVIERTSRPGIYIARVARCRSLPMPVPHSIFVVTGRLRDIASEVLRISSILERFFESLRSRGIASSCT